MDTQLRVQRRSSKTCDSLKSFINNLYEKIGKNGFESLDKTNGKVCCSVHKQLFQIFRNQVI